MLSIRREVVYLWADGLYVKAGLERYKRVTAATALIWKVLMVAERKFRRLNAPGLLAQVYAGVKFVDGRRASPQQTEVAALTEALEKAVIEADIEPD